MRFIGFYSYTVILTYLSLISSLVGMKLASDKMFGIAVCCLVFSGICDLFDGAVARLKKNRTVDEKQFGIQIDSLCDLVAFGVFPAIFLYCIGVNSIYGVILLAFYVLCAVIRLGFFNVLETKRQESEGGCAKEYRGLPVTTISIVLPIIYLLGLIIPINVLTIIYYILPGLVGFLFIADFRVPKIDISRIFKVNDLNKK